MSLLEFDEFRFRTQVDKALLSVKKVLDTNRNAIIAEDEPHEYVDKYYLAEWLTRTAVASQVQVLASIGVSPKILSKLKEWSVDRSVTIRLHSEETCEFDRKVEREVERATRHEREYTSGFKITDKVIDTITEFFWNFGVSWALVAYQGNNVDDKIVLQNYNGRCELKTTTDKTPKPKVSVVPEMDLNITWLLQQLSVVDDEHHKVNFRIDRQARKCRTPRRNEQVDSALSYMHGVQRWSSEVHQYFTGRLFSTEPNHGLNLGCINDSGVFVPVVPLFERGAFDRSDAGGEKRANTISIVGDAADVSDVVLPISDVYKFLDHHQKTLNAKHSSVARELSKGKKLIVPEAGKLLVSLIQFKTINQAFSDGINFIEEMLRKQIVAAIGKAVTPVDFSNYMRYHNRKVFKERYQPKPFSYHVRRPAHYPEGVLSIEQNLHDGSAAQEIETTVRHSIATQPMKFPINASTNVSFMGHRYLHAWIDHQFAGQSGSSLNLSARARQFSSFILMVGTIGGANLFLPKFSIIIKDKDDLRLPLILETIPAAKEFRDAIESLSPEQQRFAKAYRAMQLASTLFGVLTIQIKPQMEKLMNLAADGLAKEIQLTQDLQDLFLRYQIPSDLLAFDETNNPGASNAARLQGVKDNVKAIQDMIQETKEREIAEAKEKARLLQLERAKEEVERTKMKETKVMRKQKDKRRRNKKKSAKRTMDLDRMLVSERKVMSAPPAEAMGDMMTADAGAFLSGGENGGEMVDLPAEISVPPEDVLQENNVDAPAADEDNSHLVKNDEGVEADVEDYTLIPQSLDSKLEAMDTDGALRPTTIKIGPVWTRRAQKSLLGDAHEETLNVEKQKELRVAAFDLLDALSRSGSLTIEHASLHVVIASTHCFDKNLMDTLVQDNVNPIEKLEASNLLVATTIQKAEAVELLRASEVPRISIHSVPVLFP